MSGGPRGLTEFIEAMKSQGTTDEFAVALSRQHGWSNKRMYQAFSGWYEARFGECSRSDRQAAVWV